VIRIAVLLDIVLLVSTTFGVCSIPGIVIDSDTNPRIDLRTGSMTDGNADGACLLWVIRVLGTTTCFADATALVLNVTGLIPIVLEVPITDKSSVTRILRYLCKPVTAGVAFDFTSLCGNTHDGKEERENDLHSSCCVMYYRMFVANLLTSILSHNGMHNSNCF
jgi:hypothetical protein